MARRQLLARIIVVIQDIEDRYGYPLQRQHHDSDELSMPIEAVPILTTSIEAGALGASDPCAELC